MPKGRCKIHGESWVVEMCEHLYADLEKGIYQTFYELPVKTTRMCMTCFDKYGVQEIKDAAKYYSEKEGTWLIARNYFVFKDEHPDIPNKIDFIYNDIAKKRGWECKTCIEQIRLDSVRKNP